MADVKEIADRSEPDRGGPSGQDHPTIVAVGASAGGVQALQTLFSGIPDDTGASFVVVVHLDPERHSELPAVLAARAALSVVQVHDNTHLRPNTIYVIPPGQRLQLVDHQLSAVAFDEPRGKRAPIDSFFRSLAERLGDGVAIVLSGAGSDGALGVRAVKEAGGIILVQDPNEAEYASMPSSAIATGAADFVLPVRELAARLTELLQIKPDGVSEQSQSAADEEALRRVLGHVRMRTGHDFSKYKRSTVLRRVARRMQVTRTKNLKQYYDALRESQDEAQALFGDLLISVTTFFRDPEVFQTLKAKVIPQMFEEKGPGDTLRAWVPGCATGEEVYSIAMLLLEEAGRRDAPPQLQVFGSDLDARALAIAREGRYPGSIDTDVSEERLRRYFIREGDGYRVRQDLRDTVLFAVHDLLKDPPFSHVDLISCRNLLIYLDRELQEQVGATFHYALNPGGYLLLGSSETVDKPQGLFRTVDRGARIYQARPQPGEKHRLLPRLLGPVRGRDPINPRPANATPTAALSDAVLHRRALEKVAPPSILVDAGHRVIHLSDSAGRFIQPSGGPLTGDLADLVRPELRFDVRSALDRVFEQQIESSVSLPISVKFDGSAHRVIIHARAGDRGEGPEARNAIVMFIDSGPVEEVALPPKSGANGETVRRLAQELDLTQSRLRTVREESETTNEELRAANEELQSMNEEYRSTSEELETSKEELQSINEELETVNSELKLKLDAISRAHSDLQNLMAATDFGTLFLDTGLRIKRFTDPVTQLFSITRNDEGRPITDFAHRLEYDGLLKDAREVLADLAPIRRELRSLGGRLYDVRLRPYRTVEDKIDGVVITFVDISERRQVDEALRESERQLNQQKRLVELSRSPIFIWEFDGGIVEWNRGSEELYGYSRAEAMGQRKEELLRTTLPNSSFGDLRQALLDKGSWTGQLRQVTKDGRQLTVDTRIELESVDGRRLVLESTRDVTERAAWERRQRLLLGELTHRVKNTLAVVQAIAQQTLRNSPSSEEFVDRFSGRLAALGSAHGLLVDSEWQGADLGTLARVQLQPYASEVPNRLKIEGPPVALPADLATPFGLVLHELATNAAKHGSLSVPEGTVSLRWSVAGANPQRLKLVWEEKNGPSAKGPAPASFGSSLIEGGIPNAKVTREFRSSGLVCTIEVPLNRAADDKDGTQD